MDFENWQYHETKLPTDKTEKEKLLEELAVQFREELLASEAARNWLSQHGEPKREHHIKRYVDQKLSVVNFSSYYITKASKVPELRFREETEQALDLILHKKLFDLQCQWRAGNIELPGVEICFDFICWAQDIRSCPFLDDITEEELTVLRNFVMIDNFWLDESIGENGLANHIYEEITERDENGKPHKYPNWYEYYDHCMGTGNLLALPNIRGEKEQVYLDEIQKRKKAELEAKYFSAVPTATTIEEMYADEYDLACCVDDKYYTALLKAIRDEEKKVRDLQEADQSHEDYATMLTDIPNLPPVRGGLNWRQALRWCYQDYVSSVIYEDLPVVCESYMLYRSMGIQTTTSETLYIDMHKKMREDIVQSLLDGRELLGEPRDLNF